MTEPHPAALTPEQMAKAIVSRWRGSLMYDNAGCLTDDIADAIRSAVQAERESHRAEIERLKGAIVAYADVAECCHHAYTGLICDDCHCGKEEDHGRS